MERSSFEKKGYIKGSLTDFNLDIDEAFAISKAYIEKLVTSTELEGRDINYSSGEINSFHALHKCDELMALYYKSGLIEKIGDLLGKEVEIRGAELFAKPAYVGLASPWHQDNFYWCLEEGHAVTVWIAYTSVGPVNGGLSYLVESHKLGTLNHEDSNAPGSSQTVVRSLLDKVLLSHDQITHHLSKGEFLIHHSNMIHGSGNNESAFPRTALTIQVKAKKDRYDPKKLEFYNKRLNEQIEKRKGGLK